MRLAYWKEEIKGADMWLVEVPDSDLEKEKDRRMDIGILYGSGLIDSVLEGGIIWGK